MLDGWTSAGSNGSSAQRAGLDLGDQVAVGEQHRTTIATLSRAGSVPCRRVEVAARTFVR